MSDIREKIESLNSPNGFNGDEEYGFDCGVIAAADIAEAEVARLEDVISDLNGIIAQYVTDEKRLEARVLELESIAADLVYTLNLYCPDHTLIEKAERVIGGE